MGQGNQNYEEMEIDLNQYIKVIIKRKKTLIAALLLTLAIGTANILLSPKIYSVSMMIQPPVVGQSLTGANDLESAENLKGLIISGAFNDALNKKLNLEHGNAPFEFKVIIPNKTNILQVSIDLESKKREFGVILLQNLNNSISDSYVKIITAKTDDIINQIKLNDRAIINAKEKNKNLQEQIKETLIRKDQLLKELKAVNLATAQIWEKRDLYLKESTLSGSSPALFLASYLQNNSNYLNQLNNQYSDLSMRRINLSLELKNIDSQISGFQMEIDKLNIDKGFISNLKTIAPPRVSANPVNSNKNKILAISIVMGLFLGILAIFFQEFWINNLAKK